ncbi:anti-sigma-factor antagonist [Blastococcus sp. DSM 46786]|uniref:STAS domain-containing protein n=1 Tax=Blastococcus sp. DSM 46786 TaxID=1798227 RepID=UPI0008C3BE1A|nr:STAS domain-containing protein [Blastococcus sp. DSM 46786]SEL60790.1 anti-sigma-factor antagonist [Blastococcus sp. DSM 46786]
MNGALRRGTCDGRRASGPHRTGELDLATAPQLTEAAEALLSSGYAGIVVDLTPTVFLDSSGSRTLIAIARKAAAAGAELHVVAPRGNRPVRLPIDLLDLGAVVPIVNSVGEVPSPAVNRDAT